MAVSVSPGDAPVSVAGRWAKQAASLHLVPLWTAGYINEASFTLLPSALSRLCGTWECVFSKVALVAACWCCLSVAAHSLCSLLDFFGTVASGRLVLSSWLQACGLETRLVMCADSRGSDSPDNECKNRESVRSIQL